MPELKMSNLQDLLEDFATKLDELVDEEMVEVNARQLGLDIRAGGRLYIDSNHIIVESSSDRNLQYYGGFEYVDPRSRMEIGNYVIYSRHDGDGCRVGECLDHYEERDNPEESE